MIGNYEDVMRTQRKDGTFPFWWRCLDEMEATTRALADYVDIEEYERLAAENAELKSVHSDRMRSLMLDARDVRTPCESCGGSGVRLYSSTSTWRGGIGGQAMTSDVCNICWGSGDSHRPWPSHRQFEAFARKADKGGLK